MPILVNCDICGKGYRLRDEMAGEEIACKECGSSISVPGDETGPSGRPRLHRSSPRRRRVRSSNAGPWLAAAGGGLALVGVIVVVVLVATRGGGGGAGAVAEDSWQRFSPSADSRFTVMMPGTPRSETRNQQGLTVTAHTARVGPEKEFAVAVVHLPFAVPPAEADMRLDSGADGFLKTLPGGGRLVSKIAISLGGYPGREVLTEAGGDVNARIRLYLVDTQLIMAQVAWKGNEPAADVAKFFDSFQITGEPGGDVSTTRAQQQPPGGPQFEVQPPFTPSRPAGSDRYQGASVPGYDGMAAVQPTGRKIAADTPLHAGMIVLAPDAGGWYASDVLSVNGDTVHIHYRGWSDSWDRTFRRSELQLPPDHVNQGR